MSKRRGLWRPAWAAVLVALSSLACAGHAERTAGARSALDANQPQEALELLNEELEVKSAQQLPAEAGGDNTLLLLDRSMVLQQLEQYKLASRDLETADKQIEVLDFSRNAADELGKYLFSDDTGPYKAPAYEKLMINTMNMVNYLVRGDLNGARIEARRFAVMQKFISEHEDPGSAMLGPGSYLAGFTFEKSKRAGEAIRYYDEALSFGTFASLKEPVRRLSAATGYSSPRLRELLGTVSAGAANGEASGTAGTTTSQSESASAGVSDEAPCELLTIVNFGRVPAKVAERIPIGLALTYASSALSPGDIDRANYLAAQGLVTWVNYPELGKARGQYETPGFAVDGAWQKLEGALAVDKAAKAAWDASKGAVVASAITRMLARAVAGEAVRQASGKGVEGALLSLLTQATLTATDTPDTRSWSTLPARMAFGRIQVSPGTHWVELRARGEIKRTKITLEPGGWAVVALTVLG